MSLYHGKCTNCGEKDSLERVDDHRFCFICYTVYMDGLVVAEPKPVDQDDARKYDYYSDWTSGF
jgi:hypothetical protein